MSRGPKEHLAVHPVLDSLSANTVALVGSWHRLTTKVTPFAAADSVEAPERQEHAYATTSGPTATAEPVRTHENAD